MKSNVNNLAALKLPNFELKVPPRGECRGERTERHMIFKAAEEDANGH